MPSYNKNTIVEEYQRFSDHSYEMCYQEEYNNAIVRALEQFYEYFREKLRFFHNSFEQIKRRLLSLSAATSAAACGADRTEEDF